MRHELGQNHDTAQPVNNTNTTKPKGKKKKKKAESNQDEHARIYTVNSHLDQKASPPSPRRIPIHPARRPLIRSRALLPIVLQSSPPLAHISTACLPGRRFHHERPFSVLASPEKPLHGKTPDDAVSRQRRLDVAFVLEHLEQFTRREVDLVRRRGRVVFASATVRIDLDPERQL